MELLTVKQVAELAGCTERGIRKRITQGKLSAVETMGINNKKQYMLPVAELPETIRERYYAKAAAESGMCAAVTKPVRTRRRLFSEFSAAEREQIRMWTAILENWQLARQKYDGNKTKADEFYIASLRLEYGAYFQCSLPTLYRKWEAYIDGDLDALVENRGGANRGQTKMPEETWNWFMYAYLDQRQITIEQCYKMAVSWTQEFTPELVPRIPHCMTFRRRIEKEIPRAVQIAGREGDKAYFDRAAPYITRMYDDLRPNEYWVADNHTLDIISKADDGETKHRLSLTAFIDARSGVIVGWNLTDNPCSASTVLALKHAIQRFGIPDNVYFDNGSEFLTHDLAGRGHRKRKSAHLIDNPPGIFDRLGMHMTNAIVKNAKAKPIERTFNTFKGTISRMFDTFCGGNVLERPENLKDKLKRGNIPKDSGLRGQIADMIDGIHNVGTYGGAVAADKGKRRIDVWNEHIRSMRKPDSEEDLTLMLMRTSRPQKIGRNGVYLTISGMKLEYWDENTWTMLDRRVYVRYDPECLETVRIYDAADDRYICTLPMADDTRLMFNADSEDVAVAQKKIASVKKAIKGKLNECRTNLPPAMRIDILDMQLRRAHSGLEHFKITAPDIIETVSAKETPELRIASGGEANPVVIDIRKMNKNALKNKGRI